jgi:hypothetical protein
LDQAQRPRDNAAGTSEPFDYHEHEHHETLNDHEGENEDPATGIDRFEEPTEDQAGETLISDENRLAVQADTPTPVDARSEYKAQVLPHDDFDELYGEEHERDPITTGDSDDHPRETDPLAVGDIHDIHSDHAIVGEVPADGLELPDEADRYDYGSKLWLVYGCDPC